MKRWLEILVFVTFAIAVHIVFFASGPKAGSSAGGSGGETLVSIEAAAQTVVEMVNEWERPPVTQTVLEMDMEAPEVPVAKVPAVPQIEVARVPRAEMLVAMTPPDRLDDPQTDVAPPPPPSPPKPEVTAEPDVRPQPRPKEPAPDKGIKADTNSAGRDAQKSAGSGGNTHAGSGTAATAVADRGQAAKLQAVWGAKIRARIEHYMRYPRGAKSSEKVIVELAVSRGGRLINYRIRSSSGNTALDNAALSAIARAKKFQKAPKKLVGNTFRFSVPVRLGTK